MCTSIVCRTDNSKQKSENIDVEICRIASGFFRAPRYVYGFVDVLHFSDETYLLHFSKR
jgi:hypothetical protein